MASTYFSFIHDKLKTLWVIDNKHQDRYQLDVNMLDARILEMFCMCLEALDEQGKEISLRSMNITHLKRIWVEEEDTNLETWPKEIQDFDPVTFGLERKIQQSKPKIEKWWEIQQSKPKIEQWWEIQQSKSSKNHNTWYFFHTVHDNVNGLLIYNRAAGIVPIKNQIKILNDMLKLLSYSVSRVERCIDSKELLEYRNFVHVFSYGAACLVCLYWAKKGNKEIATEMNIALFDLLHKIKPFAVDATACYFAVLKSNNLLLSDDVESIFEGQTPAKFVDFFFAHTILKDDFLILRERLIFLFTFLAYDPQDNAEEEDLIRSQIYALLREDAYLLLPISEMKEDFSNKKMLLSDFMNKIDILNANIIQLYYRPSDSWNNLEAQKMSNIYFASLQRDLSSFKRHVWWFKTIYLTEIRFLRSLFFQCFETWDDSDEETNLRLSSIVASLQWIWEQEYHTGLLSGRLYAILKEDNFDWRHLLDLELKEKFQTSKQEINAWLASLSHCSFHCRPSTSNKILKFLDSILNNMSHLVSSRACKDVAFKKQNEILEEKLLLLKNFLTLATNCAKSKNLEEFNMLAQVFANNAACLIYLYWAKETNGKISAETNLMLSNILQKIKPNTPDVARMYIETLKAICLEPYDSLLLLEQTTTSFVDYFFEDLVTPWKNDFQILRDEVIFYLTFVHHHHHHTGNAEEIICTQLDVIFNDGVYGLLPFDDMKGDFSKKKVGLSNFLMNIRTENAKIRQLYCKFPDSFVYNFPRIIGQGFIDCLLQKLRNLTERMISDQKYVPFAKYKITTIEEELLSLTPIFNQILELKDLNDVCLEVVNVVYLAEHVISLCFSFYHLIWHYIPYLSDVVDRIKVVRTKLEKIEKCNMYNARCLPHSAGIMSTLLEQDRTSEIDGVVVGFEEDENIIIDNITRGTESLDIVSIVGMGGLGKTTLAKKVYGSSLVKSHFNIFAFSYVSQDHNKRRLLLDILRDIVGVDVKTSCMTEDDLAHKLKKCLSRQKYFIVLDDIWNINAWDEVRSSFPNDKNGSRVLFTTRSLEVAKRGQIKCSPHHLRFLSEDESWNLLQKKLFHNDMPPPNISGVAELVAKKCYGLPLAIVVVASLLARTDASLWIEISKRVSSYLSDEGCMSILELSYKHLPEYLKPCLLYLGAFPNDSSYRVKVVTLLWIDEGFIKESNTKSLNDVAKEYLYELVDRSLIIVDKMTIGEIHNFRVHDLVYDFCRKKWRDEKFFQLGNATSSFLDPSINKHYHVSVQKLCDITVDAEQSLANTRSLLCFPSMCDYERIFPLMNFRFVQVLYLKGIHLHGFYIEQLTSLVNLRHIEAEVRKVRSIPSSISNMWNMQSLILMSFWVLYLPESLWRMKSLRHVKVHECNFAISDGYKINAYPQLDKLVSFSRPILSSGKDVEWLLQRLPAVRELDCILDYKSVDSIEERVETFDFHRKLESLKLHNRGGCCPYLINFPSTLIKLTLAKFELSSTAISAIAELQCLRILKLQDISFPGPTWEMEDVTFPNLKYFELCHSNLVLWNANTDSFPCLEHLYFYWTELEELPNCFGEISSLKKITLWYSPKLESSALGVQEEQMELGNKVELVVSNLNN